MKNSIVAIFKHSDIIKKIEYIVLEYDEDGIIQILKKKKKKRIIIH